MNESYVDARHSIRDGDIIFFGGSGGWFSGITKAVTKSKYWHVGVAFWMTDSNGTQRLMVVEGYKGGRRVVNLSAYADKPFDVLAAPVFWTADYADGLLNRTGIEPYGYFDLPAIALRETLGVAVRDYPGEVCSEMVAKALNRARHTGYNLTPVLSPQRLWDELTEKYNIPVRLRKK